jgi:hypothetical protein
MPPGGVNGIMNVTGTKRARGSGGTGTGTSHCDTEVSQVATVKELTSGRYQVTATGAELALLRSALDGAERVSRFGIEVLDEADTSRDGEPSHNRRLLSEIDALAMREASLKSLAAQRADRIVPAGAVLPDAGRLDVHGAATSLYAVVGSARPETTTSWRP